MNALCERKVLGYKSSCILITLAFFLIGLIACFPYIYLDVFEGEDFLTKFTNSYFETVSGYTTTGISLIENKELPKSLVFYRALSQWNGGLGIIFILLAFFYPEKSLDKLSDVLGLGKVAGGIKKSFITVFLIYLFYTGSFILIFYFLGVGRLIETTSLVMTTISTSGSFKQVSTISSFPLNLLLIFLMGIGGTSYVVHHRIFSGNWKRVITTEFLVFISLILLGAFLLFSFMGIDFLTSLFHVTSALTSTGFSYIQISLPSLKLLLICFMFIGGCSFSTSGGIKVLRLIIFLKSIPESIKRFVTGKVSTLSIDGNLISQSELVVNLLFILLSVLLVFLASFLFVFQGYDFLDSLFECVSIFSTTGLSVGITSISLPILLKWVLIVLMILGRIEIIPFLVTLIPLKESTQ